MSLPQQLTVARRSRLSSALAAALLLASIAPVRLLAESEPPQPSPQPDDEGFSEQVEVNVVNVEVFVTDGKGNPVTGLTRADFQVFEDAKPVEVTNFYAASAVPAAAVSATAQASAAKVEDSRPEDQRLHLVVFLDDLNTQPGNRNRMIVRVREFLTGRLNPGDQVMLVRYDRSPKIVRPFTTDHALIAADLEAISRTSSNAGAKETYRDAAWQQIRNLVADLGGWDPAIDEALKSYAESEANLTSAALGALDQVVSTLSGVPGRKAVLYVSDGISLQPGEELFQLMAIALGGRQNFSPQMSSRNYDMTSKFRAMAAHASRNGVALYPLEASGAGLATELEQIRTRNQQDALKVLAEETGGRAMLNVGDAGPELALLARDVETFYSLGYRPPRVGDGVEHKIEVKVKGKGLSLRHRQWYRDKPVSEAIADRTATAMIFGMEENPLGIRVEIGRQAAQGDSFVVHVRVRIPLSKLTLIPRAGNRVGHLRFFVVASGNDTTTPVRTGSADIRIPEQRLAADLLKDYVHEVRITLKKGEYAVGVGVRDDLAAATSYLRDKLTAGGG